MFVYSFELRKLYFAQSPKVLNSVDVIASKGKFIVGVANPKMLLKTIIYQAVICLKSIRIYHCIRGGFAFNNRQ